MTTAAIDGASPPYQDPEADLASRVEDLLGRMTVAEKLAQIGSRWVFQLADGPALRTDRAHELLSAGLGQVTRMSGASSLDGEEAARLANAIQEFLATETRLGIPAIVHEEICSGLMAKDCVVFPQAIGVASTWEPGLAEAMADAVRRQMRSMGAHQGLSPVLDVCRDPRWGRTEETFGEDPHLVACMGVAFVRGLQGDDLRDGVVATAKHFVGYGASEGGLNWAPAHLPDRELREVYLHPFEATVRLAGLRSVMNGYHELDGEPCGSSRHLLTEVLRDEWGFDGVVVSDYFSVRQLAEYHHLAPDASGAAALALSAGLDVELPSTDCFGAPLADALTAGLVDTHTLDTAVRRVLRTKFELGLFEQPLVDIGAIRAQAARQRGADRDIARAIARKSLILLSNDGVLPLAAGSVAVIGPNADEARHLFGDYAYPAHVESLIEMTQSGRNVFAMPLTDALRADGASVTEPTVLDALRERLGDAVTYARGCDVNTADCTGFPAAVAAAAAAEVAVLVMGDKSGLTDDCTSGESRDRTSLDLPGVQEDLVRAVLATGTPVVLVLVAGRPAASAWLHEHCAAVVMAWLPGAEGAAAIAEVLLGEVNPGGKLPMSFPRTTGQIPVYYGHKLSGGRSHWKGDYVDSPASPLYTFGHGRSYTTFSLSAPQVRQTSIAADGHLTATVVIANTGTRTGDEVIQLYVRRARASLTRPVLELKGFLRAELVAGQRASVTFDVPAAQLGFYDRSGSYVVEPGEVEILIGTASDALLPAGHVTITAPSNGIPPAKAFHGSATVH